jgi:hypothetical protein
MPRHGAPLLNCRLLPGRTLEHYRFIMPKSHDGAS